jgi:hypothetical protein
MSRQDERYLVTLEHVVEVLWIRTIVNLFLLVLSTDLISYGFHYAHYTNTYLALVYHGLLDVRYRVWIACDIPCIGHTVIGVVGIMRPWPVVRTRVIVAPWAPQTPKPCPRTDRLMLTKL